MTRIALGRLALLASLALLPGGAGAAWPERPVTLVSIFSVRAPPWT